MKVTVKTETTWELSEEEIKQAIQNHISAIGESKGYKMSETNVQFNVEMSSPDEFGKVEAKVTGITKVG